MIKAILIDSGRVLNEPVTGHWMIPPNFFRYVDEKLFYSIPKERRREAFHKASGYISQQKWIRDESEEYEHFNKFYKILAGKLSELNLNEEKINYITKDLVYNYDKYSFFDDVGSVISKLNKKYKLAVVSDAWPSLENVFIKAEMRKYFDSFIISSKIGVTKPNELMYKKALIELGVDSEETVFIDDNPNNCDGAKKAGINQTYLLCRDLKLYLYYKFTCKNHIVIRNLKKLLKNFKSEK